MTDAIGICPMHHNTHSDSQATTPAESEWHRRVSQADRAFAWLTEVPAGILVFVEILLLFSGVVSRYVFHKPLTWSDELASTLFLWLAMLGSVVAFRRAAHMRMTALVSLAPRRVSEVLELIAVVAALIFLLGMAHPAYEFAADEMIVMTPSLDISNAWRAAALPIGIVLMVVAGILKLAEAKDWRPVLIAVSLCSVVALSLYFLRPVFQGLGNWNLFIFFVCLVAVLVFAGVPIAFAFGLATLGYIALATSRPTIVVVGRMDEGMAHLVLLSVPLFVFLGIALEVTGMAKAMVRFLAALLGHVRGGLSYVLIAGMYLVSGISGSKAADMAAIAPVLFPEMRKRGENEGEMLALLAATGAQTETIPPSIVLITIGSVAGISIAALFAGGLVPALVLAVLLCCVVWWRNRNVDVSGITRATGREIGTALVIAFPALALPFIIRAAVVEGVATATEVSTIGIAYTLVVGAVIYRQCDVKRLWPALIDTAALSGAILLIIGTATGMAWALTQSGFSRQLAVAMTQLPGGATGFMVVSLVAFVVLGSVLEGIPAIVVFGPLLFPIAKQFGINEVHYSMVVVLAMGIGLFAPPFGVGYYAACAISRINPNAGMRPLVGYIVAMLIGTFIVAAVPGLSIGFGK
jgi:tripartite ATP-independent transporter DctM subunit